MKTRLPPWGFKESLYNNIWAVQIELIDHYERN